MACAKQAADDASSTPNIDQTSENTENTPKAIEYQTVEWVDLMPKDDLDALMNPPSYIDEIDDGSLDDQIDSQLKIKPASAEDDRYQQALISTRVIGEMDQRAIRIPGFIVPLEFDDMQRIKQFFLVPFFGACIHVPPPPPNQIIYVTANQGLELKELYEPFWISGVLEVSLVKNDMATAAYSMQMDSYETYTEPQSEPNIAPTSPIDEDPDPNFDMNLDSDPWAETESEQDVSNPEP